MNDFTLPGLSDTTLESADAFQFVADQMNVELADFVSARLQKFLTEGNLPADASGAGPTIVAVIAAMMNCAGRLCASFEPHLNGDVIAEIAAAQFNEGRADQKSKPESETVQ